jgi:hypothetical protein
MDTRCRAPIGVQQAVVRHSAEKKLHFFTGASHA